MTRRLTTAILAAGRGTRMRSRLPKVLHPVGGAPILSYPIDLARQIRSERIVVVLGHGAREVKKRFDSSDLHFVLQRRQNGTADAVRTALREVDSKTTDLLVLCGDTPLLRKGTIDRLIQKHRRSGAVLTVLTAEVDDPAAYGRIVRDPKGRILKIVERAEANPAEQRIREVNSGVLCFQSSFLKRYLSKIRQSRVKKEYYLTDLIALAVQKRMKVETVEAEGEEILGINDRLDLARADKILNRRIVEQWMLLGVTLSDPDSVRIDRSVEIGTDVVVHRGTELRGSTRIGSDCEVGPYAIIDGSIVGRGTRIYPFTVIEKSEIGTGSKVGPSAHLREGTILADGVRVGNFVEVKKTRLGRGSKAAHLSYLGDAEIGADVNIGCGTITCNYDGVEKHRTIIEEGAFIGSDSQLVAPIRVGKDAYVASGSTLTKDVPAGALAIARGTQRTLMGWSSRRRKQRSQGQKKRA